MCFNVRTVNEQDVYSWIHTLFLVNFWQMSLQKRKIVKAGVEMTDLMDRLHLCIFVKGPFGEFFLFQIKGLRSEGDVCWTDCKALLRHICDFGLTK